MNPFSYGTIVRGGNFYDRKEESARLINTLSGGNNMVLLAPRRFGKTSLVFNVIERLERRGFLCVYFDFMPVFSPESFVRLYTKALSAKMPNLKRFAQIFASTIKSIRPVLTFGKDGKAEISIDFANAEVDETVIAKLIDLPEQIAGKSRRVIVFFDEFQEVEKLQKSISKRFYAAKFSSNKRQITSFWAVKRICLERCLATKVERFITRHYK